MQRQVLTHFRYTTSLNVTATHYPGILPQSIVKKVTST